MPKANCIVIVTFQCWMLCLAGSLGVAASKPSQHEKIIADLLAAKTDAARKELLKAKKEFITIEIEKAVITEADRLFAQGSNSDALSAYALAHLIAEQIDDKDGISSILRAIGDIECAQGQYRHALELYEKSLKLGEKLGNKKVIALALKSIGSTYVGQAQYKRSLEYYQKSLGRNWAIKSLLLFP